MHYFKVPALCLQMQIATSMLTKALKRAEEFPAMILLFLFCVEVRLLPPVLCTLMQLTSAKWDIGGSNTRFPLEKSRPTKGMKWT